jgi:hypothetical protein
MKRVRLLKRYSEDMNYMFFKIYILTTLRLLLAKWWLSLVKIFSLTIGILSFLLVWFFYIDQQFFFEERIALLKSCSTESAAILGFIIFGTAFIYFLIVNSQVQLRNKELFFRKYYGESQLGIIATLLIETGIFILIAFILSLVLIDQIAPFLNIVTEKSVDIQQGAGVLNILMILSFLGILGFVVGILPSLWYARNRAVDILKKLPK